MSNKDDIKDLNKYRPKENRTISLFKCDYEWKAVFNKGSKEIECPGCRAMRPLQTYGADIIGPFRGGYYFVTSYGYRLPNVRLYKRDDTDQDWTFELDARFEVDVSTIEVLRWASILGNAMAISAGYSCFGENSNPSNLYKTKMTNMATQKE